VASSIALFDVNVLVALFFPDHVHHELAHDWFSANRTNGWATCPLTVNGFVRVACRQVAGEAPYRPADVVVHFRRFCEDTHHEVWTDVVSLLDTAVFSPQFIRGPQQVTDVYLLGLARTMGGRLATFDRTIPTRAVQGGAGTLLVIEP